MSVCCKRISLSYANVKEIHTARHEASITIRIGIRGGCVYSHLDSHVCLTRRTIDADEAGSPEYDAATH